MLFKYEHAGNQIRACRKVCSIGKLIFKYLHKITATMFQFRKSVMTSLLLLLTEGNVSYKNSRYKISDYIIINHKKCYITNIYFLQSSYNFRLSIYLFYICNSVLCTSVLFNYCYKPCNYTKNTRFVVEGFVAETGALSIPIQQCALFHIVLGFGGTMYLIPRVLPATPIPSDLEWYFARRL